MILKLINLSSPHPLNFFGCPSLAEFSSQTIVLPLVVKEATLFTFKFWLNDQIQDGMHHQQEMFCRLHTVAPQWRAQLYQFGCKLSQSGTPVVISLSSERCSLWVSLRDPLVKSVLIEGVSLDLPKFSPDQERPDSPTS